MFKMKLIITSLLFSFGSVYCLAQNNNAKSIDVLKTETAAAIQSNYDSYKLAVNGLGNPAKISL